MFAITWRVDGFAVFTPDDMPPEARRKALGGDRDGLSIGWADTVEEAWRRWEEWMEAMAAGHDERARDLRESVTRARKARNA